MATTADLMNAIHRDEVDGVPLLWAETPGPLTATLLFRVGVADEQVHQRGLTHLIEHAALEPFNDRDFDVNGVTELLYTSLFVRGRPGEVSATLAALTTWLRTAAAAAVDGIHSDVLAAEEHERRGGIGRQVLQLLFGNGPHGRAALPEYGLPSLSGEEAMRWGARWFHSGNARLLLSGPPPADLRLDLPAGLRHDPPAAPRPELALPAWHEQEQDGCTLAMLTGRGAAASLTDELLATATGGRLRHEAGDTYGVGGDRVALALEGPRSCLSMLGFGLRPDRHVEGTQAFIDLLGQLAVDGVDSSMLARLQRRRERINDEPTAAIGLAHAVAREELLGDDGQLAQFLDEQHEVTATDVAAELRARFDDLLVIAPSAPVELDGVDWSLVPAWSPEEIDGQRYRPRPNTGSGVELRVSGRGTTLVANEQGDVITVPFDACEALLRWDDGTRLLLGRDGFQVLLRAEGWPDLINLGPWLDDRVPDRVIDMGEREIPQMDAADSADDGPAAAEPTPRPLWVELGGRLIGPAVVAVLLFGGLASDEAAPDELEVVALILLVIGFAVGLIWSIGWWLSTGRHRRGDA